MVASCNKVVFFGRRPESNPEVSQHLDLLLPFRFQLNSTPGHQRTFEPSSYRQLTDKSMCATCRPWRLLWATSTHSSVKWRILSTQPLRSTMGFENVLRPKIIGSWNLHVTSQELNLALECRKIKHLNRQIVQPISVFRKYSFPFGRRNTCNKHEAFFSFRAFSGELFWLN